MNDGLSDDERSRARGPEMLYRDGQIDRRIMAVSVKKHWMLVTGVTFLVVLNLAVLIQLARLSMTNHKLIAQTNYVIKAEIPALNAQIERRDFQLADAKRIQGEAVAVILRLAHQVVRLGGNPGQIVLK